MRSDWERAMNGDLGRGDGGRRSGRKTRKGGRGFWEGRTSQSIDGSSTCASAPPRSVPGPARLGPRSIPLFGHIPAHLGAGSAHPFFGKECGSAHLRRHLRSSHSKSLALGSCTLHTACISMHWHCIVVRSFIRKGTIDLLREHAPSYVLHASLFLF